MEDDHDEHGAAPLPLEDYVPPMLPAPERSWATTALAVLQGIPHTSIDLTKSFKATVDGRDHVVNFDNWSHASGRQRGYIRCQSEPLQSTACSVNPQYNNTVRLMADNPWKTIDHNKTTHGCSMKILILIIRPTR